MAIEQIERLPDVSFIDDDINLDGIQKQMLQDYQDKYMEETGEETVLDRGEPIALILYACSVQIYQMYMYVAGLAAVLSMPLSAARLSRKAPNAYLRRFCFPALSTYMYIW